MNNQKIAQQLMIVAKELTAAPAVEIDERSFKRLIKDWLKNWSWRSDVGPDEPVTERDIKAALDYAINQTAEDIREEADRAIYRMSRTQKDRMIDEVKQDLQRNNIPVE